MNPTSRVDGIDQKMYRRGNHEQLVIRCGYFRVRVVAHGERAVGLAREEPMAQRRWLTRSVCSRGIVVLAVVAAGVCGPMTAKAEDHYEFSWEPQTVGPCHSVRVNQQQVPEPRACPTGTVEQRLGAVTAYCPSFKPCHCTNWMDCEHAKEFPWGCGDATPWLPFKVRKCVPAGATVTIDPGPVLVPVPEVPVGRTGLPLLTLNAFERKLPDQDRINIVVVDTNAGSDRVTIRLRTKPQMWFKGIEIHTEGGVVKLEAENGGVTGAAAIRKADASNSWIVIVKAKEFGIHRAMYELPGTALGPLMGKNIVLDWISDK